MEKASCQVIHVHNSQSETIRKHNINYPPAPYLEFVSRGDSADIVSHISGGGAEMTLILKSIIVTLSNL